MPQHAHHVGYRDGRYQHFRAGRPTHHVQEQIESAAERETRDCALGIVPDTLRLRLGGGTIAGNARAHERAREIAPGDVERSAWNHLSGTGFRGRNPPELVEEIEDEDDFVESLRRFAFRAGDDEPLAVGMQVEIAAG